MESKKPARNICYNGAALLICLLAFCTSAVASVKHSVAAYSEDWTRLNNCSSLHCNSTTAITSACSLGMGDYVCRQGLCCECEANADCGLPLLHCRTVQNGSTSLRLCVHKHLFPDFQASDALMTVLAFVAVALAASAGIGGGGVLVPLYMQISQWPIQQATELSQATILGGGLTNIFFFGRQKHPTATWRPMIDYDVCLVMMAPVLSGSVVGVFLNQIFPEWLITILLIIAVGFMTFRTVKKGITILRKEKHGRMKEMRPPSEASIPLNPLQRQMSMRIEKQESKQYPIAKIAIMVSQLAFLVLLSFLKGGRHTPSILPGVHCGSIYYYLLYFGIIPILGIYMVFVSLHLYRSYKMKESISYEYAEGDIRWTLRNVCVNPILGVVAGVMAGLLGLGGGTVLGPLLLELGMLPLNVAASSAVMVFATALSTTAQFLINGTLDIEYAGWLCLTGLLAALFGQQVIGRLLKKYNKTSYITFLIAFILVAGVVLLTIQGIESVIRAGRLLPLSDPCS